MSITPLRKWMLDSIPLNLRIAMGAGVGLFIGFIGLKNGGIIISDGATFLSLGDFQIPDLVSWLRIFAYSQNSQKEKFLGLLLLEF
ncbi:MAG: hypothetical protein Ct9H90mP6_11550 [Gammaproteobacteria bacterium]|nr:MAG: hypothetical protein Ct9H90mP6_11550 [Gammaproteobacteria bacterium]